MNTAVAPDRLSAVVSALAERTTQPEVRTQLHALSGILMNLVAVPVDEDASARHAAALEDAIGRGDEAAAIAEMRSLAAIERARIRPLDFSLASRG